MIWLAILIPIATTALLYTFWRHEVVIWEFLIPFAVSLLLMGSGSLLAEYSQTVDTEFWGSLVAYSSYYEDWDEEVPCSHTVYCQSCSGSGSAYSCTSYACGTAHMYDVQYHPQYWEIFTTSGEVLPIPKAYYQGMVQKFGNQKFVNLRRNYHSNDGDKYVTTWPRSLDTAHPVTTKHTYENRVQSSRSVFNYTEVSEEDIKKYALYRYPKDVGSYYAVDPLRGYSSPNVNQDLRLLNGYFGPQHQVMIWVLIYRDQPRKAGFLQEALWVGSNKNEFVITVGVNARDEVQWARVFSWTKKERLKIDAQALLEEQGKLNLPALVTWLSVNLPKQFERREFKEFSYLKVEIPMWAVGVIFLLVLLANVITAIVVVKNNVKEPKRSR